MPKVERSFFFFFLTTLAAGAGAGATSAALGDDAATGVISAGLTMGGMAGLDFLGRAAIFGLGREVVDVVAAAAKSGKSEALPTSSG